jgi:hypothetical protein
VSAPIVKELEQELELAQHERDQARLELQRCKDIIRAAKTECRVFLGTPEIDNIGRILSGK